MKISAALLALLFLPSAYASAGTKKTPAAGEAVPQVKEEKKLSLSDKVSAALLDWDSRLVSLKAPFRQEIIFGEAGLSRKAEGRIKGMEKRKG